MRKWAPAWLVAAAAALTAPARAAAPPDWVAAAVSEPASGWQPDAPAIQVLVSVTVRFEAPNRTLVTQRGVRLIRSTANPLTTFVALPYDRDIDRVVSLNAWIVSADGRSAHRISHSQFFDTVQQDNAYIWNAERVLSFNPGGNVEPGGFVAWEFRIECNSVFDGADRWLHPPIPTRRSLFEAEPAPGSRLEWHSPSPDLQAPAAGAEPGALRWEADRLLPGPAERPDGFLPDLHMIFVRSSRGGDATWAAFARHAEAIVGDAAAPDPAVEAAAGSIAKAAAGRWDRIRALTDFVQRQVVYLEIAEDGDHLAGYRPHAAAEVLRNRFGDCKDKVTLLISMLRAAGENGRMVLLYNGDPRIVQSAWAGEEFNHAIVAIPGDPPAQGWPTAVGEGGRRYVLFDPTDPVTPLGVLPESDEGGFGLLLSPRGGTVVRLPTADPATSRLVREVDAKLDAQGQLSVRVVETRYGERAAERYAERRALADRYLDALEGRIKPTNPLTSGFAWKDSWDPASARYRLEFGFESQGYGRLLADGMMLVSPEVLADRPGFGPWGGQAKGAALIAADGTLTEVRIALPPGYAVEELPDPWRRTLPWAAASIDYRDGGKFVAVRIRATRQAGLRDRRSYVAIRRLYSDFLKQVRRPILIRLAN